MRLIVIAGPTASGKTELAVRIAQRHGGEIVNADSMQVYKYMNIGTAKPDISERGGIPHHLMDIVDPRDSFSVSRYCELAHKCIKDISDRGKLPILVGGTGLYIDSVVNNVIFSDVPSDKEYCALLEQQAKKHGNEYIYKMLQIIDPTAAEKIAVNDIKRIIRALEVYKTTGKTITEHKAASRSVPSPYRAEYFALDTDRGELYDKINRRVDIMFDKGLVAEVEDLLKMGVSKECTAMQAIGYKEWFPYFEGKCSEEEVIEQIKKDTRHFAKRQLTWFRRERDVQMIDKDRFATESGIVEEIIRMAKEKGIL